MNLALQNKRALVTGGSRGIGAAIVKGLAREGAHVALTYLSKPDDANQAMAAAKEVPTIAATRTKEVAASTDEYVHQKPWRAVTLSAGLGVSLEELFTEEALEPPIGPVVRP